MVFFVGGCIVNMDVFFVFFDYVYGFLMMIYYNILIMLMVVL